MSNEKRKPETPEQRRKAAERPMGAGWASNQIITRRNGGVRHQFADSIGGCSANYR